MGDHRFRMTVVFRDDGVPLHRYDGPFGPLFSETIDEGAAGGPPAYVVTGRHLERATLTWSPSKLNRYTEDFFDEQLARGVAICIDGTDVTIHRQRRGWTRSTRALRVSRPGAEYRYRKRRVYLYSLEDSSGRRLLGMRLSQRGTVSDRADVVDAVVALLLADSGLYGHIDRNWF
jgi:hypothetical protein